jgi:prepilin-type N-terminal cleavage/methylation domain-containing protein
MYNGAILKRRHHNRGFTLIELSIVLVIIGLIIGGVLVGQNLISAAEVRAQITQIEKYNSAVNTFRGKFNTLPGDMRPEAAAQYGFTVGTNCTGASGQRDGNGLIEGGAGVNFKLLETMNETGLFWQDITSTAAGNLIDGQIPGGGAAAVDCVAEKALTTTGIGQYMPTAKIGHGNYIYVYSMNGINWFGVSSVQSVNAGFSGLTASNANIPVTQAYSMDVKMDDGLPSSGNVQAIYVNSNNAATVLAPNTPTSGGTSSSCYDTTTSTYSVTVNNGNGGNCALSFKFQ